jgi:hypothetical protein
MALPPGKARKGHPAIFRACLILALFSPATLLLTQRRHIGFGPKRGPAHWGTSQFPTAVCPEKGADSRILTRKPAHQIRLDLGGPPLRSSDEHPDLPEASLDVPHGPNSHFSGIDNLDRPRDGNLSSNGACVYIASSHIH